MYVKVNFFMSRNFCFSFVLEYDNVLYANEVETKEKQKLLNTGLSLRAGGRGFSPDTKRVAPGYFGSKTEEK